MHELAKKLELCREILESVLDQLEASVPEQPKSLAILEGDYDSAPQGAD